MYFRRNIKNLKTMTATELMNPRFEVIADYPSNQNEKC